MAKNERPAPKSTNGGSSNKPDPDVAFAGGELAFEFIKNNAFRVISVDGVFGGVSPQGRSIQMAVYSERRAIPTKTIHKIDGSGNLGPEDLEKREGRSGFVREIDANLVMDYVTAVSMHQWLGTKIKELGDTLISRGAIPKIVTQND